MVSVQPVTIEESRAYDSGVGLPKLGEEALDFRQRNLAIFIKVSY